MESAFNFQMACFRQVIIESQDWKSLAETEKCPFDYAQGRLQALD